MRIFVLSPSLSLCCSLVVRAGLRLCLISLAGCGGGRALDAYDLTALEQNQVPHAHASKAQLIVDEPIALPPADSDRIVVRNGEQIAVVAGAQWRERLPRLLQARLLQSLENAHFLKAVGRPESKTAAQYLLITDVRRFDIDVQSGQAMVDMSVKLIEQSSGRIVAASLFSAQAEGSAADGAQASQALNSALQDVLGAITHWCAQYI